MFKFLKDLKDKFLHSGKKEDTKLSPTYQTKSEEKVEVKINKKNKFMQGSLKGKRSKKQNKKRHLRKISSHSRMYNLQTA